MYTRDVKCERAADKKVWMREASSTSQMEDSELLHQMKYQSLNFPQSDVKMMAFTLYALGRLMTLHLGS